jgi:methionyl-tRNA synthetase
MSTSRGWVVELNDFLDEFDPDMLRYYLTINAPQRRDVDFYWKEFQRRVNDELADIIGNFIHRTLSFIYNNFGGKVPAPGEFDEQDREMLRLMESAPARVGKHIEEFNSSLGLKEIVRLARAANKYFNDKQPWRTLKEDPQRCATSLYVCAQLTRSLAIMLAPYLPFASQRLWRMLNLPADVHGQGWDSAAELGMRPGHEIRKPEPLFVKLGDEVIRRREEKLQAILKAQSPTVVTAEEFAKLDIRIGKVVSVEPIPRSRKLLKLSVDVGGERRTIVAGLAQHYSPEQLAGKDVAVILNLKPVQLMGVTSEGMLLAAEDERGPSILIPDRPVKPGSKVK